MKSSLSSAKPHRIAALAQALQEHPCQFGMRGVERRHHTAILSWETVGSIRAEPGALWVKASGRSRFPGRPASGTPWRHFAGAPGSVLSGPGDGTIWRTSLPPTGSVTARIRRAAADAVHCEAWGGGAEEFLEMLPALLGSEDDASDFVPPHPTVADAHRQVPHLRLGHTGLVLEALIPAIIEQRVPGADAFRSWRVLVSNYGTPAPGPAPARMRVPPSAEVWRNIPSWEFHLANVDPRTSADGGRLCAPGRIAGKAVSRPAAEAREALTSFREWGRWTAAETMQRALGDADAVSVGDYHFPKMIGWTLLGHPVDDAGHARAARADATAPPSAAR